MVKKNKKNTRFLFPITYFWNPAIQIVIFFSSIVYVVFRVSNFPLDIHNILLISIAIITALISSTVLRTLTEHHRLHEGDPQNKDDYILPAIPSLKFLWLRSAIGWFVYSISLVIIVSSIILLIYRSLLLLEVTFPTPPEPLFVIFSSLSLMLILPLIFLPAILHRPVRVIVDFYFLKREAIVQRTYQPDEGKRILKDHLLLLIALADAGLFIGSLLGCLVVIVSPIQGVEAESILAFLLCLLISWGCFKFWKWLQQHTVNLAIEDISFLSDSTLKGLS